MQILSLIDWIDRPNSLDLTVLQITAIGQSAK